MKFLPTIFSRFANSCQLCGKNTIILPYISGRTLEGLPGWGGGDMASSTFQNHGIKSELKIFTTTYIVYYIDTPISKSYHPPYVVYVYKKSLQNYIIVLVVYLLQKIKCFLQNPLQSSICIIEFLLQQKCNYCNSFNRCNNYKYSIELYSIEYIALL